MGDYGPAHEVGTFSSHADDLQYIGILQIIRVRDYPVTWSASLHSIKLGSQVYGAFLEELPEGHWDTVADEHGFSFTDIRLIEEDHTSFRGHAANMRPGFQG